MAGKITRFEDILAWQKAKSLAGGIYVVFKANKDFSFRDQIQRAGASTMNNIAEGFERRGDREFKHYLFMAKGSAGEVRSMLVLALELNYINSSEFEKLFKLSEEISKMLSGFISKLS